MLRRLVPIFDWLPHYERTNLRGDVLAGLTGAAVLVPQSMAYATVAQLPPVVGLYASVVPLLVYAVLGWSRQLGPGPLTSISILSAIGVAKLAPEGSGEFIALSATLALIVGVVHLGVGIGRLGFLVRFISEPVVAGFLAGAGILIIAIQLGPLTGVDVPTSGKSFEVIWDWLVRLDGASVTSVAVGIAALAVMLALGRAPRLPAALLIVIVTSLAAAAFDFGDHGIALVGHVPSGLAGPDVPPLGWEEIRVLLPTALAITLVSILESLSVARLYADEHHYELPADGEIAALGASNVAAGLFQGMVVTGAVSRSSILDAAGARTQLANTLSALVVAPLLLFGTGTFQYIPIPVLSAIVIVAVVPFVRVGEFLRLWRVKRADAFLMLGAALATMALGLEAGILLAAAASFAVVMYRVTRPPYRVMREGDVAILRFDGPLFYGNVERLREQLHLLLAQDPAPRAVVLDASGVDDLDATADHTLRKVAEHYHAAGVRLLIAGAKEEIRTVADASGLTELLGGPSAYFETDAEAVRSVR